MLQEAFPNERGYGGVAQHDSVLSLTMGGASPASGTVVAARTSRIGGEAAEKRISSPENSIWPIAYRALILGVRSRGRRGEPQRLA